MIEYERTSWNKVAFSFFGTVLPRILSRVGVLTAFTLVLCLFNDHLEHPMPALDPIGHTVLGVSIGMLIVFRTNSSNNRYWEGRSHWGMILNTARNLARMAATYAGHAEEFGRLLVAYVVCLKDQLRDRTDLSYLRSLLPGRIYEPMSKAANPASMLARSLSEWVRDRLKEGRLDMMQAMQMEHLICVLLDQQGGCEKIKKTPLPFVYAALIKQLLLVYLYSLPFVVVRMSYAGPLVVTVVALGMLGIEEAGVEIENPFSPDDPNTLPLEEICERITRDVNNLTSPS